MADAPIHELVFVNGAPHQREGVWNGRGEIQQLPAFAKDQTPPAV